MLYFFDSEKDLMVACITVILLAPFCVYGLPFKTAWFMGAANFEL